ncbi:sensor histidine kinase [Lutibacter holmesii]|uniref:histidine kinase n=1 Tax=Lutibacter holmesii TaxID=1137985 RepID=A0ABW3WLD0_9FLAO
MQKLAGLLLIIAAIIYGIRLVKAFLNGTSLLFSNDYIQIVSYLYLMFLSFSTPIFILFIFKEKDSKRIENNNLELQKLNESKNKLFSIIAHDLKGPLGNLQQIGELLWKDEEAHKIDNKTKKILTENIYKTSKKTFNLLDNLLKWASTNSGNIEVNATKINLKNIIEEIISFYKTNTMVKNITIEHQLNNDILVLADYNMIHTIIRNLISNAIKFTPKDGKIEISSINQQKHPNCSSIAIKDTGVGIEKAAISKILQLDSTVTTLGTENEVGTGFGLKLCQEFIRINKGKIEIESEKNKGTTVFLSIPNC